RIRSRTRRRRSHRPRGKRLVRRPRRRLASPLRGTPIPYTFPSPLPLRAADGSVSSLGDFLVRPRVVAAGGRSEILQHVYAYLPPLQKDYGLGRFLSEPDDGVRRLLHRADVGLSETRRFQQPVDVGVRNLVSRLPIDLLLHCSIL